LGRKTRHNAMKIDIRVDWVAWTHPCYLDALKSTPRCKIHHVANKNWAILPLPNEDFGRMNKRENADFRSTFQGREYSIWATNSWKLNRNSAFHLLFILLKSSFGEHKFFSPCR
jgi:hypothetical protein